VTADVIVWRSACNNFGIPQHSSVDRSRRARRRARLLIRRVDRGLLKGKRLILVLASGGVYSNGAAKQLDFRSRNLRAALGFIGLTDIESCALREWR